MSETTISTENQAAAKSLKIEILEKISDLSTAGLGLVAALAWNDAIKNLFMAIFPQKTGSLIAQFVYAVILTVIIVIVTYRLGKLIDFTKKQMNELEAKLEKKK